MQLDPKIAVYLNIAYQILTAITAPTLQSLGIADAAKVVTIAESFAAVINIVLHAYSAPMAGPMVNTNGNK